MNVNKSDRKVVKYYMLVSNDRDSFNKDCNKFLADGWELYGDPIVTNRERGSETYVFNQAFVKYDKQEVTL